MFFSTALAPVKFEEIFLRRTQLMNMYKMYKNRLIVDLSVSVSLSARLCLSSPTDPHFYQEFHHNYETDKTCGWSLHIQGISLHINPFPLSTLDRRERSLWEGVCTLSHLVHSVWIQMCSRVYYLQRKCYHIYVISYKICPRFPLSWIVVNIFDESIWLISPLCCTETHHDHFNP